MRLVPQPIQLRTVTTAERVVGHDANSVRAARQTDCYTLRTTMAKIRAIRGSNAVRVVIVGPLGASDMRRLEHACAPALTSARAELILDLARATDIDSVAEAHLQHMASRGAVIRRQE